jgi:hypothetical protein
MLTELLAQGAIATVYGAGRASASSAPGGTGVVIRDQSGAETGASLLITEEEFRAMEMMEAARQEQVADEDKDAKIFQKLLLRKLSRGRSYRPLRCKSVGTRSRSIPWNWNRHSTGAVSGV